MGLWQLTYKNLQKTVCIDRIECRDATGGGLQVVDNHDQPGFPNRPR